MTRNSSHPNSPLNTPSPKGRKKDGGNRVKEPAPTAIGASTSTSGGTSYATDQGIVSNESQPNRFFSRQGDWRSFGLSLLVHSFLVTFLILFIAVPGRGSGEESDRQASIVLAVNSESETEYLSEPTPQPETETATDPSPTAASAAASAAPKVDLTPLELPGARPIFNDSSIDATSTTDADGTSKSKIQVELTDADLKLIARDQKLIRSRKPKGDPASVNVFGIRGLEGRRFVFVIDRSKSMGAGGLGVIEMAQQELSATVANLKPNHSFQVVAYNDNITTISGKDMLDATQANKSELPKFLGSLAAFGGTSHETGLFAGLSFRPDVLIFMTDGGPPFLNNSELKYFRNLAKKQTEIHCLQFGAGPNQQDNNFMMKLARENSGTYRYIDIEQWNKQP